MHNPPSNPRRQIWMRPVRQWSRIQLVLTTVVLLSLASGLGALIRHEAGIHTTHAATPYSYGSLSQETFGSSTSSAGSASGTSTSSTASASAEGKQQVAGASSSSTGTVTPSSTSTSATAVPGASSNHMVIKKAVLTLATTRTDTSSSQITKMTNAVGGFVQSLNTVLTPNLAGEGSAQSHPASTAASSVNMVVRIPTAQFSSFLQELKRLGTVQQFSQSGEDVTSQNNNLQSQLDELQNELAGYTKLYKQAKTMKDMITIQQSLSQVNSQIASVEQQLHGLQHSVQFATVTVNIIPKTIETVAHARPTWKPWIQSLAFMKASALGLLTFLAWVLPWAILFGGFTWGWRVWTRRTRNKKKTS